MVTERDLELLDNYVSNSMSVDEKAAFRKQLDANTELKQEFQLQEKIVESLRQSRVAELKNMLNNVPASALKGSGTTAFIKATIGIVVTGIVATGLYFYFKPEPSKPQAPVAEEAKTESPEPVKAEETQPQPETPTVSTPVEEKKVEKTRTKKEPIQDVEKPALEVFQPETEADSQATTKIATEKVATEKVSHAGSISLGIDKSNKKYAFHYQFKDDSLLLFGPFEKNVYEIMEFFSDDNKRTIFLLYKDHYYFLKEEGDKVKPLKAISDPALIKKLRDSRKK
ncbi:MAG: hypothetical protein ABI663_15770 [Chryseolinea sp.]